MTHFAHTGTYYFVTDVSGRNIGVLSVEEGEKLRAELMTPVEAEGLINQFITMQLLYGCPMTVNRSFLGYVVLSSPETRKSSQEWHDAFKKEPWEK
jgi:hypothetical protein